MMAGPALILDRRVSVSNRETAFQIGSIKVATFEGNMSQKNNVVIVKLDWDREQEGTTNVDGATC